MKTVGIVSHLWARACAPAKLPGELDLWPKCIACSTARGAFSLDGPRYPVEMQEIVDEGVRSGTYYLQIGVRCHGQFESVRLDFRTREKPGDDVLQRIIAGLRFFG